ncbi:MAG: NADH-quinone oxidoreductase subunit NuoI [Desulfurobacterium sp.]|nr:MAG: NADH-quinone oxidoreductase subunit NuoI [Desulfurobacterium sp.]
MELLKKVSFVDLLKGMRVTLRTMFKPTVTLHYPFEKEKPRSRFRGVHALKLNPDGSLRCEACYLCATMCPSNVIDMEMTEGENGEKVLVDFTVDLTRCLFCGLCVEACPRDAIVMTDIYEFSQYSLGKLVLHKEDLVKFGEYYRKWEREANE